MATRSRRVSITAISAISGRPCSRIRRWGDLLGPRNVVNAQLAYQHQSWTLTAYATNLTDQHYAGALNSGLYFAGPPRQYGVKLFKTF